VTPPQEGHETLRVRVTTLGGTAFIANAFTYADQSIAVSGGTTAEGDAGTDPLAFEVTLAQPAAATITVRYTTADGTARAGTDFLAKTGVLTFDPGDQVKRVNVQIVGETLFERDETMALVLSAPSGAVIALPTATGTVANDDEPPLVAVGDVEVDEGEAGTGTVATVGLTLSAPSGLPAAVWLATEDGTASVGSDFDAVAARVEIPPGETSATLAVPIRGDRIGEGRETFGVALSEAADCRLARASAAIVIVDDDEPRISLRGVTVPEPAVGDTPALLGVALSNPSALPVSVAWFTSDGTAQAGQDYAAAAGTVEFAPGESEGTIAVLLHRDASVEPNETFSVTLSQPFNATIEIGTGVVVVLDDDVVAPGTWVVSTVAGEAGACGADDGPGRAARLCDPGQITVGGNAALYLADAGNHVIRALATDGGIVTLAGAPGVPGDADGAAGEARFRGPRGVAHGADGTLYVADTGNHTIRAVGHDGTVVTLAGLSGVAGTSDGTGAEARFNAPASLALDGVVLYVADTGNHAIRAVRIDDATVATVAGLPGEAGEADGPAADARFDAPVGVAAGPGRTLVVADTGNHTLRIVSLDDAQVRTLAGVAGEAGDADGTAAVARLSGPTGVAVDTHGLVLVADTGNHVVRSVEADGTVVTLAGVASDPGTIDGAGSGARFDRPASVTLAPGAPVAWVTDGGSHVVRRMAPFARTAGTLELAPVAGVYGGTVTVSARLLGGGVPLAAEAVAFTLAGHDIGVATTDADGVAGLPAVALGTIPAGTLPGAVRAVFAGSNAVDPVSVEAPLAVVRAVPVVTWEPAPSVPLGTPIGPAQLNASASVPGTFAYTPPAGSTLPLGPGHVLRLLFTPDDSANHESVTLTRIVDVVPPPFSVSLPPKAVAGCTKASGKVRLASPAPPGGFVFHLTSSDPSVSVPATVTLAAGQLTKGFAIVTTPVEAPVPVTVEAVLGGVAAAAPLLVRPMAVRTVALSPNPVAGGAPVVAVATLECQAGPGPVVVALSSSKPGVAAPAQDLLAFAEGTRSATFTVTTTPVATTTKSTIRAARGGVTRTAVLTVAP
jgi:sugar lactone lactonase YvrE